LKYIVVVAFILVSGNIFSQDQHLLFTDILNKYVVNGSVNYKGLLTEDKFVNYLNQLGNTNPDTIKNQNNKIAFWINAYNAFTIKAILDDYPVESINDLHSGGLIIGSILSTTIWDKDFIVINNKEISLSTIEHEILRKKFKEPRIHFAIVCASISCPSLRNEAYEGYKLEEQLANQAKLFVNDKTKNQFNIDKKEVKLSKIFDWFDDDFGSDDDKVLLFVSQFLSEELKNNIKYNSSKWEITYLSYNWNLNE